MAGSKKKTQKSTPTSKEASELLAEMAKLMRLNGDNPFKVRAFDNAVEIVLEHDDLDQRAQDGTLTEIKGIGKGISEVLTEFYLEGTTSIRDEIKASLPEGLLELVKVPGLGPKKAILLIDELGLKTIGELEYACRENRLVKIKGFGDKVQTKFLDEIRFMKQNSNKLRLPDAEAIAQKVMEALKKKLPKNSKWVGEFERKLEVVSELVLLIEGKSSDKSKIEKTIQDVKKKLKISFPIRVELAKSAEFFGRSVQLSSSEEHWKAIGAPACLKTKSEEEFYQVQGLPWIAPEFRETGEEVSILKENKHTDFVELEDIKGVFHMHTTYSDGANTIEEMIAAAVERGYQYIGISDHSQTATYAQGLREAEIEKQAKEIKRARKKHPEIQIFWGIESDILPDGSLDYPMKVLKEFDFVIASVHSSFKMDPDKMTARIIRAVENPYTTMLGHWTGRLLLGRKGYSFDHEKVIEACAKNNVVIEINAHPARLDIDWRWGKALRTHGTRVSVNPDAHEIAGFDDTPYGVTVARKALLTKDDVLNTRSSQEIVSLLNHSVRL